MKTLLDDSKIKTQYDSLNVYESLSSLSRQFESGWHDSQFVSLSFESENIQNIIYVGMGGSNLSSHIIQSIAPLLLTTPFETVANYRLPQYVSSNSLVILVSYSGNTEEVISCAQDALKRKSNVVVITTGGKIKDIAISEHWPLIVLDEKLNVSKVPRFGIGLLLGSSLGLISRLNSKSIDILDPKLIERVIERTFETLSESRQSEINPAKHFAIKNHGQTLVIIAANHLSGVSKIASNSINETAKTFSVAFSVPDLNHHLMEGLSFPISLKDNTRFILLNSSLYPEVIQKRFQITKEILLKQKYQLTEIKPESSDIVSQVFESLVFFMMISYYLSIVNKQDPGTNPWVDFFKKQIK